MEKYRPNDDALTPYGQNKGILTPEMYESLEDFRRIMLEAVCIKHELQVLQGKEEALHYYAPQPVEQEKVQTPKILGK